jgi:hypothetical protein
MKIFNFLFLSFVAMFFLYILFGVCLGASIAQWSRTDCAFFVVLTVVIDLLIAEQLNTKKR